MKKGRPIKIPPPPPQLITLLFASLLTVFLVRTMMTHVGILAP